MAMTLEAIILSMVLNTGLLPDRGIKEATCMAEAIIYEAGAESTKGKIWAANVIQNRTKDQNFPDSFCGVLRQRGQFDYHRIKKSRYNVKNMTPSELKQIDDSVRIAIRASDNKLPDQTNGSLYFVNLKTATDRGWMRGLVKTGTVDNHTFYKRKVKK